MLTVSRSFVQVAVAWLHAGRCSALVVGVVVFACAGCSSMPESGPADGTGEVPPADVSAVSAANEREAIEAAERAAREARQRQADVFADTGRKFRDMGDFDKALESFARALEVCPDFYAVEFEFAETLARQQKNDEALRRLRVLLAKMVDAPEDRTIRRVRSMAEKLIRRLDTLNEALSDASNVLSENARLAEGEGRDRDAEELYRQAFLLWPGNGEARDWLRSRKLAVSAPLAAGKTNAPASGICIALEELRPGAASCNRRDVIRINETRWGGLPIYNRGNVFGQGTWAPAPSKLTYNLAGRFRRLTGSVLVSAFKGEKEQISAIEQDLRKKGNGTVRFLILGDGKLLFDSGVVTYADGAKAVDILVDGVKELVLEASDAADGDTLDYSAWVDTRLWL